MTVLQGFSEGVAAAVIGVPKKTVSDGIVSGKPVVGIDIIAIMALVEAIAAAISKIIDNCPQNEVAVREAIKSPTWWQRVRAQRIIRDHVDDCAGFRWRRQSSRVVEEVFVHAASSSDDVIDSAIDQVRNTSF